MTHFCLVSDQPVPNLLPVLHDTLKPQKVVLAVSQEMAKKASWLEKELKYRQIETEILSISDAYDLIHLQGAFLDWIDQHSQENIVLNVTGGTKPMAIAAQEVFRMAEKPVFYVNIMDDTIAWLSGHRPKEEVTVEIPLKSFFRVHGIELNESNTHHRFPEKWLVFSQELGLVRIGAWEPALRQLNYYAQQAEKGNRLRLGKVRSNNVLEWDNLLKSLCNNGLIESEKTLNFTSSEARDFANGGWIEFLVFSALKDIAGLKDVSLNAVVSDQTGNKNELDVVFLSQNRMFIVECKTRDMKPGVETDNGIAGHVIYKLDSLRRVGGLRTSGILVSYRKVSDHDKRRAGQNKITVIDQGDLHRLSESLNTAIRRQVPK